MNKNFLRIFFSIAAISLMLLADFINSIISPWKEIFSFLIIILSGVYINSLVREMIIKMRSEELNSIKVNQGIIQSWKNILIFTIWMLFLGLLTFIRLQVGISILVSNFFLSNIFIEYIIYITVIAFFEGGGRAILQHIALRIVLWLNRYVPFHFDLLLDYCTERLLIQRIGGRYRFMHKLLQDYFAKMELD